MKIRLLFLLSFFCANLFAQNKTFLNKYQHFQIVKNKDTINFHIYCKNGLQNKDRFLLFIQGSGPEPLYQIIEKTDTINTENSKKPKIEHSSIIYSSVPFELKKIPAEYPLVVISKKAIPFEIRGTDTVISKLYYENETLNYRVWQANEVINYITKKLIKKPKKIIALGHSEGSDVVAKLGTVNKKITHIGFWSGGGNTQFYDFAIFDRKDAISGKITDEQSKKNIDSLLNQMKDIFNNPNNLEKQWFGCSYKRWTGFSEPAIENLLKINIPIYVAHGVKDTAVPVESNLLIPIEFIRHKKNNLTYKLYSELDHSFTIPSKSEEENSVSKWNEVFEEFIKWCEK